MSIDQCVEQDHIQTVVENSAEQAASDYLTNLIESEHLHHSPHLKEDQTVIHDTGSRSSSVLVTERYANNSAYKSLQHVKHLV